MDKEDLKEIGLSDSEATIYLILLKIGEATVAKIAQASGLHRTNIYDTLEKLRERGLITTIKQENKKFFKATDPENLLSYLSEKQARIQTILPELKKIQSFEHKDISVEIFKGEEGVKSVLRGIIKEKKDVFGFFVGGELRKYLPYFYDEYFKNVEKYKIKHRFLYTKEPPLKKEISKIKRLFKFKTIPKEFYYPVNTFVYSDKVLMLIWEPSLVAILIKCKFIADSYRRQFELLWRKDIR